MSFWRHLFISYLDRTKFTFKFVFGTPPRASSYHVCACAQTTFMIFIYWLIRYPGQSRKPQTILAGAHGQTGIRPIKMGSRVQGLPRQHRWLHESPGDYPYFIIIRDVFYMVLARKYGGISRWQVQRRAGGSIHSVCLITAFWDSQLNH